MPTDHDPAPWRIVHLPTNTDARGSITICESGAQLPFAMQRARWVYGAPPDAKRGGHAHHRTSQLFVAVAGALTVVVDDTRHKERVRLDTPATGLLISPDVWIETEEWTDGAVLLMLASERHDPADYVRDYAAFSRSA